MKATLWTDGASSGNPGPSGIGVVLKLGDETIEMAEHLGTATNNVAEYTALIRGLETALEHSVSEVLVHMDSELVVRQIEGRYKVRQPHLIPLFDRARALLARFSRARVTHVRRELNAHADRLSKRALNISSAYAPK
jgi:ribonuclease HI